jgi:hypothetical protein
MQYIQDFDSYNESVKKFLTGVMLGASLLGSPSDIKAKVDNPLLVSDKQIKAELSIINEAQYTRLVNDLEKKGYQVYGDKPSFDSKKFLFVSSSSPRRSQALSQALQSTEEKINDLDKEEKGLQVIYYIHLKNTSEFIVITELISEDRENMLYDRETGQMFQQKKSAQEEE